MSLAEFDKTGLIRESYRIDGISLAECRTIFLDWAIKLPDDIDSKTAIAFLIDHYAADAPDHPMSQVLQDGLGESRRTGRRGGRRGRLGT